MSERMGQSTSHADAWSRLSKITTNEDRRPPLRIALIYLVCSLIWIIASDEVTWLGISDHYRFVASIVKGLTFVIWTAFLIYWLRLRSDRLNYQSTMLLKSITQSTTDAIHVKGRDGTYLFVNEATAACFGRQTNDLIGRTDAELFSPDEAKLIAWNDRKAIESGLSVTYEHTISSIEPAKTLSTTVSPYRNDKGQILGVISISRDVSEIKNLFESIHLAQRQTKTSLAQLQAVLYNLVDGIIIAKRDGTILDYNLSALFMMGYREKTRVRKDLSEFRELFELRWPDGREVADSDRPFAQLRRGEQLGRCEMQVIRRDTGLSKLLDISGSIISDVDGGEDLIVLRFHDLTETRKAKDQLRESEQRFREFARAIPQMVWVANPEGDLIHVDEKAYDFTGLTAEELLGMGWEQVVHPDDLSRIAQQWKEMLATGTPQSSESRARTKHGKYRWVLSRQSPSFGADGKIVSWYGTITDIDDLKRAENENRVAKEMLRLVLDNIPQGVFWKDREFRFLGCNRVVAEALGLSSPDEIIGKTFADISDFPTSLVQSIEVDEQSVVQSSIPRHDIVRKCVDNLGRPVWHNTSIIPMFGQQGDVIGILGTWYDITERQLTENKLHASEETLRQFIENVPLPIAMFDNEMRYVHVSRRWMTDFHLGDQNIIGRSHYDVLPGVTDEWKEINQRCLAGVTERREVDRYEHDGIVQWVRWEIHPWKQADGGIGGIVMFSEDITDRRRVEAEQQRSMRIIERSQDLIAVADLTGRLTYMNEYGRQLIGFDRDAPINTLHFTDYVPETSQHVLHEALQSAANEGHWEGELEVFNLQTKRQIYVYRKTFLISDPSGERWFATVSRDITERKLSEKLIRESEERYRRLVEVLPEAVFINVDDKITFCNRACLQLFGANSEKDLLGKSPFDLIHPELDSTVRSRIEAVKDKDEPMPAIRQRMLRLDGTEFPAYVAATPISERSRKGILVCVHDITERERAMEVLQSVLGSVEDTIVTINDQGIIQLVNKAVEKTFGYTVEELIGKPLQILMPEQYQSESEQSIRHLLRTGDSKLIGTLREFSARRRDGTIFPIELHVTQFKSHETRQFTGVIRDITERKRLENAFQHSQKMEAVGRLAGGVAHDFNNLLTVINGYGNLLLTDLSPNSPQREFMTTILDAGERAGRLTQQLLAFSRKAIVEPKLINLNDIVDRTMKMLRRLVEENITVRFLPDPSNPHIKAAQGQLEQILMNMVVNSRDAMPDGGALAIETKTVQIDSEQPVAQTDLKPGEYVQLSIADTGHGMSEDIKARIFEPFFTTKGVGKGTGLGLSVVHGVVKQCGGAIIVDSRIGAGTTFKLLFPIARESATNPDPDGRKNSIQGTETILLVEDEDAVRKIARIALESKGYRVLEASGGRRAIEIATEYPDNINLLLTDVVMPEMNGPKLAAELRALRPTIRVLFMSGYTDDDVLRGASELGSEILLQKPFTANGLARKVRSVLDDSHP